MIDTIVHSGVAIGWYRCDGKDCPICEPFDLSEWDFDHPGPYTYSAAQPDEKEPS